MRRLTEYCGVGATLYLRLADDSAIPKVVHPEIAEHCSDSFVNSKPRLI
jgi:hypothetical protein